MTLVATLPALMVALVSGATVTLAPGPFPATLIQSATFNPPAVIDATGATVESLTLRHVSGLTVKGGTWGGASHDIFIDHSDHVTIAWGVHKAPIDNAITVQSSTDVTISGNEITGSGKDGIDVGGSQRVTLTGNACSGFAVIGAGHPDCIQLWSLPDSETTDVLIAGNVAYGDVMGFGAHHSPGEGTDHYARVVIDHNAVALKRPNGVDLLNCDDCTVSNNVGLTLPGSTWQVKFRASGGSVTFTNNTEGARP